LEWWWTPPGGRAQLVRASDLAPNDRAARERRRARHAAVWSVLIATLWAAIFLYLPLRLAASLAAREGGRAVPPPGERRGSRLCGVGGGGGGGGGAAEELNPDLVREALHQGFAQGWHDKYPPLHYMVLSLPIAAFDLADRSGILPAADLGSQNAQLVLMRLVS